MHIIFVTVCHSDCLLLTNTNINPNNDIRYWDDGKIAKKNARRYYSFRRNAKARLSPRAWHKFLLSWSPDELNIASKIVRVTSEVDLDDVDRELLVKLRDNHELLLLPEDASYAQIRDRLVQLHKFGILNLSLNPLDYSIKALQSKCEQLKSKNRSVTAKLRESRKRYVQATKQCRTHYDEKCRAESERDVYQRLLKVVNAQLASFRISHPDWEPPKVMFPPHTQEYPPYI